MTLYTYNLLATTFIVENTNNTGSKSLRQAIIDANADASATVANPHVIKFKSGVSGTIVLASGLPGLNRPMVIDGSTSGGSRIVLEGDPNVNIQTVFGILAGARGSTIQNFVFQKFESNTDMHIILDDGTNNSTNPGAITKILNNKISDLSAKDSALSAIQVGSSEHDYVIKGNSFAGSIKSTGNIVFKSIRLINLLQCQKATIADNVCADTLSLSNTNAVSTRIFIYCENSQSADISNNLFAGKWVSALIRAISVEASTFKAQVYANKFSARASLSASLFSAALQCDSQESSVFDNVIDGTYSGLSAKGISTAGKMCYKNILKPNAKFIGKESAVGIEGGPNTVLKDNLVSSQFSAQTSYVAGIVARGGNAINNLISPEAILECPVMTTGILLAQFNNQSILGNRILCSIKGIGKKYGISCPSGNGAQSSSRNIIALNEISTKTKLDASIFLGNNKDYKNNEALFDYFSYSNGQGIFFENGANYGQVAPKITDAKADLNTNMLNISGYLEKTITGVSYRVEVYKPSRTNGTNLIPVGYFILKGNGGRVIFNDKAVIVYSKTMKVVLKGYSNLSNMSIPASLQVDRLPQEGDFLVATATRLEKNSAVQVSDSTITINKPQDNGPLPGSTSIKISATLKPRIVAKRGPTTPNVAGIIAKYC